MDSHLVGVPLGRFPFPRTCGRSLRITALDARGAVLNETAVTSGQLVETPVTWTRGPLQADVVRLRVELNQATLYALKGLTLTDEKLPPPGLPALVKAPVSKRSSTFDAGADNWSGVDRVETLPGGTVKFSRSGASPAIAHSDPEGVFAGDWTQIIGGNGARIRAKVRAHAECGTFQIEVFARNLTQWSYVVPTPMTGDWVELTAELRYDWTEEEAAAHGWRKSAGGFTWRETLTHAGKLTVLPLRPGPANAFELDEVIVEGL